MGLFSVLRVSPHLVNYGLMSLAALVPIVMYTNMRAPGQEALEVTLVRAPPSHRHAPSRVAPLPPSPR